MDEELEKWCDEFFGNWVLLGENFNERKEIREFLKRIYYAGCAAQSAKDRDAVRDTLDANGHPSIGVALMKALAAAAIVEQP